MLKHYIRLILLSMVPLIELRGAIPYSQLVDLPIVKSYIISIIANMIPIPIVFLFARHVLNWGKDKPIVDAVCRDPYSGHRSLVRRTGRKPYRHAFP